MRSCRAELEALSLTDALPLVGHSDGPAQQTGRPPQVARAGVDDAVISAQVLLGRRHLRADPVARHAVRVVGLVHDARGAAGAQDVTARFWGNREEREGRGGVIT